MAQLIRNQFADELNRMLAGQASQALGRQPQFIPQFGIGDVLSALAPAAGQALQQKGLQMQTTSGLQGLGIAPEVAESMSYLPEDQQKLALAQYMDTQAMAQKAAQQQQMMAQMAPLLQQQGINPQEAEAQAAYATSMGPKGIMDIAKFQQKERQAESQRELDEFKLLEPTKAKMREDHQKARDGLHRIARMRELEKEGLQGPTKTRAIEALQESSHPLARAIGGIMAGTVDPQSQVYQKLQQEFLRDMRAIYGGRVAVAEMEQFLKGIPTLMNTREGRERIYKNLEWYYRSLEMPFEIAQKITTKSGKTPLDLADRVEAKMQKKLDKMYSQFDWGSPKPENYLKTVGNKSFISSGALRDGQRARNKVTGEEMIVRNGRWEKA